jgi:DNA mismatch repair ATPase MutS
MTNLELLRKAALDKAFWQETKHGKDLLLIKCGDFYEALHDDAITISKVLNLAISKPRGIDCLLVGIPYHCLGSWTEKLANAGFSVLIKPC